MDNLGGDVDCVRGGDGELSGRMELGVGCGGDAVRAAGAGGRSHVADRRVLSGAVGVNGGDELGLGGGGVGRVEVFQACEDGGGGGWLGVMIDTTVMSIGV